MYEGEGRRVGGKFVFNGVAQSLKTGCCRRACTHQWRDPHVTNYANIQSFDMPSKR